MLKWNEPLLNSDQVHCCNEFSNNQCILQSREKWIMVYQMLKSVTFVVVSSLFALTRLNFVCLFLVIGRLSLHNKINTILRFLCVSCVVSFVLNFELIWLCCIFYFLFFLFFGDFFLNLLKLEWNIGKYDFVIFCIWLLNDHFG